MQTFEITIRATVTKTITVRASNETNATKLAHELFTMACDGHYENYNQETLDVEKITNDD